MTGRLAFIPAALIAVFIAVRLDLTYVGLAVLLGMAIPIVSMVRGRDMFPSATLDGSAFVIIGFALLVLAYFVCSHYGISFESLDRDRSFPKAVRRLPYFGIAFLTAGVTEIAISIFRQRQG
jgi:hypothetical protein